MSTVTSFRTAVPSRSSGQYSRATGAMATSRRDEPLLDLDGEDEPNPFLSPAPPDISPVLPAPPVPPRSTGNATGSTSVAEGAPASYPSATYPSVTSSSTVAAGSSGGSSRPHNGNPFARELEEERARLNVSVPVLVRSCCNLLALGPVQRQQRYSYEGSLE